MKTYQHIQSALSKKNCLLAILIDPDEIKMADIAGFATVIKASDADLLLFGGSLVSEPYFDEKINVLKEQLPEIPIILFPGSHSQLSSRADAVLFLSLLSGRNPEYLIGNHIMAAPVIKAMHLEAISTAYLLIESGRTTTVEYVSNTKPIPRSKPDLAVAHALAAQYLGFKLIYLEAGSGAEQPVPPKMIRAVKDAVDIPVIVGGGITLPENAAAASQAGADIIVIGNHFQIKSNRNLMITFRHALDTV